MISKLRVAAMGLSFCAALVGLFHCGGGDDAGSPGGSSDAGGGGDSAIVGDGGSGGEGGGGAVIDVNGTIATRGDLILPSHPVANAAVTIVGADGKSTSTTSGADGTFHATGIATPYDVWLPPGSADGGSIAGSDTYYEGITRPDPALVGYDGQPNPPTRTATLTFTANACASCQIYVTANKYNGYIEKDGTGAASAYSDTFHWLGDTSTTMDFFMVVYQAGILVKYAHFDAQTVTDTGTLALGTVSFDTLTSSAPVQMSASYPPGLIFDFVEVDFRASDGDLVGYESATTATHSFALPSASWKPTLLAVATGPDGNGQALCARSYPSADIVPNAVTFAIPDFIEPIAPLDKAVAVPANQHVVWSPVPNVNVYYASFNGVEVFTGTNGFDLGKLVAVGAGLPSATEIDWIAETYQAATSMDDLTQPGGPTAPTAGEARCFSQSPELHFVTK